MSLGKGDQAFGTLQVLRGEKFGAKRVFAAAGFRKWFALPVLSRQQPVCQWKVRQKANSGTCTFRQHLSLRLPIHHAVIVLDTREVSWAFRRTRRLHLFGRKIRATD